jgi:hypothetical protein
MPLLLVCFHQQPTHVKTECEAGVLTVPLSCLATVFLQKIRTDKSGIRVREVIGERARMLLHNTNNGFGGMHRRRYFAIESPVSGTQLATALSLGVVL